MATAKIQLRGQFAINRNRTEPLSLQIVRQLQEAIETGRVAGGTQLPSTRSRDNSNEHDFVVITNDLDFSESSRPVPSRGRASSNFALRTCSRMGDVPRPGIEIANGDNIEVDPPHRLVQTFRALWNDDVKLEGESRVTWEIEPVGDSCRLRVTHDQLRAGANAQLYGGWPMILSGLKTWLEAGAMLTTPGAIEYLKPEARI